MVRGNSSYLAYEIASSTRARVLAQDREYVKLMPTYRKYLSSKVACFDAFVIVVGFVIDVVEHGDVVEEIASLVVILRLWRFVKIVDEFSVEASEQWDEIRMRIESLEKENMQLRAQLRQYKQPRDVETLSP